MSATDPHLLLVNPSAGGGRAQDLLPRVEAAMRANQLAYRVIVTTSLEQGCAEARAAAAAGEVVAVMSGDGLIGQVGGALAEMDATFGIIPGGRGNDLARVLGVPVEIEGAVRVLAGGHARPIDVGEVNGRRFLCIASCGFDSEANRIANEARWIRGRGVYLYAALRALAEWKPARFSVTLDGEHIEVYGYAVAVANSSAYGGGMFVAPHAELDDGRFDVVCTADTSKLAALRNLPKVFDGSHTSLANVSERRAAEVRIEADRPFAIYADGEHLADLPATLRVLPRALRILAPPADSP